VNDGADGGRVATDDQIRRRFRRFRDARELVDEAAPQAFRGGVVARESLGEREGFESLGMNSAGSAESDFTRARSPGIASFSNPEVHGQLRLFEIDAGRLRGRRIRRPRARSRALRAASASRARRARSASFVLAAAGVAADGNHGARSIGFPENSPQIRITRSSSQSALIVRMW
jgi:hypothetical protein